MKRDLIPNAEKALVTVFEDLETAQKVIKTLIDHGFTESQLELVSHDVRKEAPELETPKVRESTASLVMADAARGGGFGLTAGLLAGIFAPFPGLALGMIAMGGITGAIAGGMAGAGHAVHDDQVNLPTIEEYEALVQDGNHLVVVLGSHADAMRAEDLLKQMPSIRSHVHMVHGHQQHEHPAHDVKKKS